MKVLFLTQGTESSPSPRYRVYQLLPGLQTHGIEGVVLTRRELWQARVDEFDVVVVQKGITPGLTAFWEKRFARRKPLVYDLDDAMWLPRVGGNPLVRLLHRESSVQAILRCANTVIAGNGFLADYARRFNPRVTVVPSAVNVGRYSPANNSATIGWIGSRTTLPYLKSLGPVFRQLGIQPLVIAAGDPAVLGFPVEFQPWRLETELANLAQIGIGIAPLPDTPWERGKCGVKLLQYMACGIPVVASPVGVHHDLVRDGVNGFLARDETEWTARLRQLQSDAGLRARLGAAGRAMVEEQFDIKIAAEKVAVVLKSVTL